jgi:ABC-type lipoprotein release transport system permease subunit
MMVELFARMIARSLLLRLRRSLVTFLGVAVAVVALVILESVMVGVGDAMLENSVALHHGHIMATWEGNEQLPDLAGADVLNRTQLSGMMVSDSRQAPIKLYGIHPGKEQRHTVVARKLIAGSYLAETKSVIIGLPTAETLQVAVGDAITFWRHDAEPKTFQVEGIFSTAVPSIDEQLVFTRLASVYTSRHEAAIFASPGADLEVLSQVIRSHLPSLATVKTWRESLAELDQLIELNQVAMNVVLILAIIILAFGVSNTAFVSAEERSHEIGILKATGLTPANVVWLVILEAVLLVTVAGLAGVGIGGLVTHVLSIVGLDLSRWTSENPHFIVSGVVYPRATARTFVLPLAVAVFCGLVASAFPAWKAARASVMGALRQL